LKISQAKAVAATAEEHASAANERARNAESQMADANARASEANARAKQAEAQVATANAASKDAVAKVSAAEARIADANARAAEAQRSTESERLERLRLEAQIAPRSLSLDQQRVIALSLERFAGRRVSLTTYSLDAEGAMLGQQLMAVLRLAHITVEDNTASIMPLGGFSIGVHVSGSESDLVMTLYGVLSSVGRLFVARPDSRSSGGAAIGTGKEGNMTPPPVSILIGVKPVPLIGR
jgi:hypothetical protein